jgi:hypothetical protein
MGGVALAGLSINRVATYLPPQSNSSKPNAAVEYN